MGVAWGIDVWPKRVVYSEDKALRHAPQRVFPIHASCVLGCRLSPRGASRSSLLVVLVYSMVCVRTGIDRLGYHVPGENSEGRLLGSQMPNPFDSVERPFRSGRHSTYEIEVQRLDTQSVPVCAHPHLRARRTTTAYRRPPTPDPQSA